MCGCIEIVDTDNTVYLTEVHSSFVRGNSIICQLISRRLKKLYYI